MITFKQFLSEKVISKAEMEKLQVEKAIELLNKHCKNGLKAIENGDVLYRGEKGVRGDFILVDSKSMVRTSRDTNNLYQLMMDNSTALNEYPKRENSIICTTDFGEATAYHSNVRVLFPFDGTNVVTTGVDDLLARKIKTPLLGPNDMEIQDLTNAIDNVFIFSDFKKPKNKGNQYTDIQALNSFVSTNQEKFAEEWKKEFGTDESLINSLVKKREPFTAISSNICTPKNLGLKLVEFGNLTKPGECWFSGKCVSISLNMFKKILIQLRKTQPIEKFDFE